MADRYWVGGAGTWNNSSTTNWSTGSGGSSGASAPTSADNVIFDDASNATAYTVTVASTAVCANLTIAGPASGKVTFNFGGATLTVYGSFSGPATGLTWGTTGTITFAATSGTQTITTNGVTMGVAITINGAGGTFVQQDALTTSYAFTFTNGTYNQNNLNLTCLSWASSNSNTRVYTPGTGGTFVTGNNATVVIATTLTGFSYTTAPTFSLTYSGSTGTRTFTWGNTAGGTESNAANFSITAGSDIVSGPGSNNARPGSFTFTGFSGTWTSGNCIMVGDLTLSPTMTITASTSYLRFYKTSGTQNITTNGVTIDMNLLQLAPGATVKLIDNLTGGAAKEFNFQGGTLNLNDKTLTVATFASSTANVRQLAFGTSGKIVITGSGSTAWVAQGSNQTLSGTGTISFTSNSNKTFSGGAFAYPTISLDGTGVFSIGSSNTFADIKNTVTPVTVSPSQAGTQTFAAFSLQGTAGNLVTVSCLTVGARTTLSMPSGTVSLNYCSFKDIAVTGGVFFKGLVSNGCVEGTNTTGIVYAGPSQMIMFG